jgi:thiaminase (transcriptional activator TenA)
VLHEELLQIADPVLRKVIDHPFWAGLRDGSLPGEALVRFVRQDTDHLLPAYARALARSAAAATDDAHTMLLGRSVFGTLEARDRLRAAFTDLGPRLGLTAPAEPAPVDPATHAHCSFFNAAAATSLAAGIGALMPMVWFNFRVSDDLRQRCRPGSRYAPWAEMYHPGENYQYAVKALLGVVDQVGERASDVQRRQLVDQFSIGVRYEWAFAEAAWRQPCWPV